MALTTLKGVLERAELRLRELRITARQAGLRAGKTNAIYNLRKAVRGTRRRRWSPSFAPRASARSARRASAAAVETNPATVALAKKLARYPVRGRRRSLRDVAAELTGDIVSGSGHTTGLSLTDIAFVGNQMYGTTLRSLYEINDQTGAYRKLRSYTFTNGMNALLGDESSLLGASYNSHEIYRMGKLTLFTM